MNQRLPVDRIAQKVMMNIKSNYKARKIIALREKSCGRVSTSSKYVHAYAQSTKKVSSPVQSIAAHSATTKYVSRTSLINSVVVRQLPLIMMRVETPCLRLRIVPLSKCCQSLSCVGRLSNRECRSSIKSKKPCRALPAVELANRKM